MPRFLYPFAMHVVVEPVADNFSRRKIRKYLAELIGTFTLVFDGTGAIVINDVTGGKISHVGIALVQISNHFILEVILTFLLMFVIMNLAHGSKEQGIMAGAAIGAVVVLEAMFAGPICGASMNTARSLAPAHVGKLHLSVGLFYRALY